MTSFYWTCFKTFFKIGAFTLGGGSAMIPIIEADEFIDLIAISQSCPGVFAINMSVFIGYKLRKLRGAICTCAATALPSFLIILMIAMFFHQFENVAWVKAAFNGIRPAVVALIAAPTFSLAKRAQISLSTCWIPVGSALLIWALHVNPVYIILAAGVGGYLYGRFVKPTE